MADQTYQPSRVELTQGGDLAYGGNVITNNVKGLVYTVSLSTAAGSSNVSLTTITFKDETGSAVAYPVLFNWWLSDASTGIGLTATTASGAVAVGATGTDLTAPVAKKLTLSQSSASGVYIASITDTAKTGFYIAVQTANSDQPTVVSAQLTSGSYG